LKYGSPTLTRTPRTASEMSGYSVPRSTVKVMPTNTRLFTRMLVSRETTAESWPWGTSRCPRVAISTMEITSRMAMNTRKVGPMSDWVKECTELKMPERVMKVPRIVRMKLARARLMVHILSIRLRSWTMVECMKAVAVSHGRKDAFSTGSHAQ
jgi:hypothetical protein